VATALAGSGVGGVFNLGVVNTVDAETTLTGATAGGSQLRVENGATSQTAFGVIGRIKATAPGTQSAGVRGINSGTNGNGFGVWGFHQGSGAGVFGETGAGTGLLGKHTSSVGAAPGVQGETSSTASGAVGVLGRAPASGAAPDSAGIRGVNGGHGYGVEGVAGPASDSIAIFGRGTVGPAVKGVTGSSGVLGDDNVPAVSAVNESPDGSGVFGVAPNGGVGVRGDEYGTGTLSGSGVLGFSPEGTGVLGVSQDGVGGVFVTSQPDGGNGVEARTNASGMSGVVGQYEGAAGTNGVGLFGVVDDASLNPSPNTGIFGVLGTVRNRTGVGVAGISNVGAGAVGVLGSSTSGLAGRFDGHLHTTGRITKAYTSGTSSQAVPVAYGTIRATDGVLLKGTPNVSSTYDSVNHRYLVTIANETYATGGYITSVTPTTSALPRFATTTATSGKLAVKIFDADGGLQQAQFSFITYKP
jgi:hypothetical protein